MPEENIEKKSGSDKKNKPLIITIVILAIIIILLLLRGCGGSATNGGGTVNGGTANTPIELDDNQGDHVDLSTTSYKRNITLPGWATFRIKAGTTKISSGIEFHNPDANVWSAANYYVGEDLVMSSLISQEKEDGSVAELDSIIKSGESDTNLNITNIVSYDSNVFEIEKTESGKYSVYSKNTFDGVSEIVVKCDDSKEHTVTVSCTEEKYYMTFALYLDNSSTGEEDTLLYQSNLVSPGKYIQTFDISESLEAGTYDAYVFIQPYFSDMATPTNNGNVKVQLIVE